MAASLCLSPQGLRSLFSTLIISLPAFWNVGALLGLVMYIYSYMGVLLFGELKQGTALNEHANFTNFPLALLTLFRLATNDNWNDLMDVSAPS